MESRVNRVRADLRSLATGLEAYYVDNNEYPCWATGDKGANAFLPAGKPARERPTFRIRTSSEEFHTLTTPQAYLTFYFPDPFAPGGGDATYSYYKDSSGWIMISAGPDKDYDIAPEKLYRSDIAQPTLELLTYSYDPTNGLVSDGDIFWVKQ